jgi:hypothetical protein
VQFSYDSNYGGGSPASFEMRVYKNSSSGEWEFQNVQELSAVMGGNILMYTANPIDFYATPQAFYANEVLVDLQASDFAPYFNFSATYGFTDPTFGPYFIVKFTAKQNGVGYNLSSLNIYTSDQISFQNNISGVNNTANLIPVTIDDTSFEFKTRDNDKLFQLTLNVTETSVYNRQNQ